MEAARFAVKEERKIIVESNSGCWVPDFKEVDGKTYVLVKKWDSPLTKWITGKALRFGEHANSVNEKYIDDIIKQRNEASQRAVRAELLRDRDTSDKKVVNAVKRRKVTPHDTLLVSSQKVTVGPYTYDVLPAVSGKEVWVEATSSSMFHLFTSLSSELESP